MTKHWGANPGADKIRARDDAFRAAARSTTRRVVEPKGVATTTGQHLPLDRRARRRLRGMMVDGLSSAGSPR